MNGIIKMARASYRSLVSAGGRWAFIAGFVLNYGALMTMYLACRFGAVCGLWYMDGTVFESFGMRLMTWLGTVSLLFASFGLVVVGAGRQSKGVRKAMFRICDHIRNGVMIAIGSIVAYALYDYRVVLLHPDLLGLLVIYSLYAFGIMMICRSPMNLRVKARWDAALACASGVTLAGLTPYLVVQMIDATKVY